MLISLWGPYLATGAFYNAFNHKAYSFDEKKEYRTITVSRGDTLWDLAKTCRSENEDLRYTIYRIRKINNLKTSSIFTGQVLKIPY